MTSTTLLLALVLVATLTHSVLAVAIAAVVLVVGALVYGSHRMQKDFIEWGRACREAGERHEHWRLDQARRAKEYEKWRATDTAYEAARARLVERNGKTELD